MKKFATIACAVVLSISMLTGCSSSKKAAETTTEVKEETVNYAQGLNDDGTLEGVKATDYVTVCDYSSIKIPEKDVKVSDNVSASRRSIPKTTPKTRRRPPPPEAPRSRLRTGRRKATHAMIWKCRTHELDLARTRVMGIVNVTPDSFSDGGLYYLKP